MSKSSSSDRKLGITCISANTRWIRTIAHLTASMAPATLTDDLKSCHLLVIDAATVNPPIIKQHLENLRLHGLQGAKAVITAPRGITTELKEIQETFGEHTFLVAGCFDPNCLQQRLSSIITSIKI